LEDLMNFYEMKLIPRCLGSFYDQMSDETLK